MKWWRQTGRKSGGWPRTFRELSLQILFKGKVTLLLLLLKAKQITQTARYSPALVSGVVTRQSLSISCTRICRQKIFESLNIAKLMTQVSATRSPVAHYNVIGVYKERYCITRHKWSYTRCHMLQSVKYMLAHDMVCYISKHHYITF